MDTRKSFPLRAPALYLLPGIISGLLLARALPAGVAPGCIALALALLSCLPSIRNKMIPWLILFSLSTFLGVWSYGSLRLPPTPSRELLTRPPREALVQFEVERVMQARNRYGQATGIGRVIQASELSRLTRDRLIYFRLSRKDRAKQDVIRGQHLEVTGVVHPVAADAPDDSFDAYLMGIGIYYRLEQTSGANLVRAPSPFKSLCQQANEAFQGFLRLGDPGDNQLSRIYIAMLLGEKAQLTREQKDRFRTTGTMHLFAISGLHIGVVAAVIWQVLLLFRLPSKLRPVIGLPLLYFYVETTGATPSAIRAFLMVAFFWLSMAVQRQRSPLSALAASAVFVLLIQPLQLWQLGFQLSYLVVLSILMFGLPLREYLRTRLQPKQFVPENKWSGYDRAKSWLCDKLILLLAISLSAWLASAPLSAGLFGFIAPYSIVFNILLVNLATLVISGGVIVLSIASLSFEGLALFLNHSAWLGISLMDAIIRLNTELPGATIACPSFPAALSYLGVLIYTAGVLLMGNRHRPLLRFVVPPLIVILTLTAGLFLAGT